jgi:hypothetical protein
MLRSFDLFNAHHVVFCILAGWLLRIARLNRKTVFFILLIDNCTVIWFVQCPSHIFYIINCNAKHETEDLIILLIDNATVIWFVQCPSRGVLYFGRLTFADCTVTKNRLKNSNIFMTLNDWTWFWYCIWQLIWTSSTVKFADRAT